MSKDNFDTYLNIKMSNDLKNKIKAEGEKLGLGMGPYIRMIMRKKLQDDN